METLFSKPERKTFLKFVESLKLVRKAHLEDQDTGELLIDKLYTDLLPKNGILDKINLPRTTIVNGRKGTGKSTIFQKSINDIIKNDKMLCIYIDVKSLVDNTVPPQQYVSESLVLSHSEIRKYLTYVEFLKIIIHETKKKIQEKFSYKKLFDKLFKDEKKFDQIIKILTSIEENSNDVFKKIDVTLLSRISEIQEKDNKKKGGAEVTISSTPKAKLEAGFEENISIKKEFQNTIETFLDIKRTLIDNLILIRDTLKLKFIYIYLDDFSEIEMGAQQFFIDWFIAPLNNLSEDFIKFKIAAYPYRFYRGKLDPSKYDTINLDFYDSYNPSEKDGSNISIMESLALSYTHRLINNRSNYYFPDTGLSKFFDMSEQQLADILFEVSHNVTRKIGFILSYCYESCIILDKRITESDIKNASKRYFHEVIEKYFKANAFVLRSFSDKVTIENLNGLLNEIIKNSLTVGENGKNSHFVVNEEFCYLLETLSLNGYISVYNQVMDSENRLLNIYSLDYGLCAFYRIDYDKPKVLSNELIDQLKIDQLIIKYFNNTQILKCEKGHEFEYKFLEEFKTFHMNCPNCIKSGILSKCEIVPTNKDLINQLEKIEKRLREHISYSMYLILEQIFQKKKALPINYISENIDFSAQTVEKLLNELIQKKIVVIDIQASQKLGKNFYHLTEKGHEILRNFENINRSELPLLQITPTPQPPLPSS